MKLPYLLAALCFCNFSTSSAASISNRGLDDVFPGFDYPLPTHETHAEEHSPERDSSPTHLSNRPTPINPFMIMSTGVSSNSAVKTKDASTQSHQQSTTSSVPTTNSIIGTIPPLPSATPWSATAYGSNTVNQTSPSSTSTVTPISSEDKGSSHSIQEWKIIGVAVIAFTTVAAILLLSVFFDHWWGFIRDLFWKKKRKDNVEELIPDWNRASWAYRLGHDRQRYPTMPPAATTKEAELGLDRWQTFSSVENVAGIGSGSKGDAYSNLNMKSGYQPSSPWTRGLGLSPLPPAAQYNCQSPPGRLQRSPTHQSAKPEPHRSPPSPALTDPYGGIAE